MRDTADQKTVVYAVRSVRTSSLTITVPITTASNSPMSQRVAGYLRVKSPQPITYITKISSWFPIHCKSRMRGFEMFCFFDELCIQTLFLVISFVADSIATSDYTDQCHICKAGSHTAEISWCSDTTSLAKVVAVLLLKHAWNPLTRREKCADAPNVNGREGSEEFGLFFAIRSGWHLRVRAFKYSAHLTTFLIPKYWVSPSTFGKTTIAFPLYEALSAAQHRPLYSENLPLGSMSIISLIKTTDLQVLMLCLQIIVAFLEANAKLFFILLVKVSSTVLFWGYLIFRSLNLSLGLLVLYPFFQILCLFD